MPGTRRTRDELLVYKDPDPLGRFQDMTTPRSDMPPLSPGTAETNGSIHNLGDQQLALRNGLDAVARLEQGLMDVQNPLQRPTGTPDEQRALFAKAFQQGGVTPNGSPSRPLFGDQPQPGMFDGLAMRLQNAHAIGQGTLPFWAQMQQHQQAMQMAPLELQMKRQQMARQLEQLEETKRQNQWEDVFKVMGNDKLTPPQQVEMLRTMGKQNPIAHQAQSVINEKMIADFNLVKDDLGIAPEQIVEGLKSGQLTWHDLSARVQVAKTEKEAERKALAESDAKQKKIQGLLTRFHQNPEQLNDTELDLVDQFYKGQDERKLKIQELQARAKGQQLDLQAKEALPVEGPTINTPEGAQRQYLFNRDTGLVEQIVGQKPISQQTNINLPAQEKKFEEKLGELQVKRIEESQTNAEDALQVITNIHEGRKLLDSGMITGFGAEFLTSFGQALHQIGFNSGKNAVENTQAYAAVMAGNVGKIIKQFGAGTGLSDADREYAAKMVGGQITLNKESLLRILELNEKAQRNIIKAHNKKYGNIKTNVPLSVTEPPEYTKPASTKSPQVTPYSDPDKERRYQEWKKRQGQ